MKLKSKGLRNEHSMICASLSSDYEHALCASEDNNVYVWSKIKMNIDKVIIHEDFDPINNANDIALIRLDSLVPLHNEDASKSIIAPICLPWNELDNG